MTEPAVDLSIIIPAYQEAAMIAESLRRLADWLKDHDYGRVEVLVVVCESPDGTLALAHSQAKHFDHCRVIDAGPRVGKGYQVRLGMFEAAGRYRLFMDADLATPLHHLDEVKGFMDGRGQVGIAVRNLWRIHPDVRRRLISTVANLAAQVFVVPGIRDTQCGFKVFSAEAAKTVFSRQTLLNWSFDLEILAVARHFGYRIIEFPVPDWRDPKPPTAGLTGDSQLMSALREAGHPITIRWGLLTGRYKNPTYHHKFLYP